VIGFIALCRCGLLRQHELNAGLDRIVVAPEDRNSSERSVLAIRVPALLERRLALALESLAAHRRSEHAALAPAPHFLAGKILHDEVVSLTVGESQLEHLGRVVLDAESEFQLVRIFPGARDVERRHDRRAIAAALCLTAIGFSLWDEGVAANATADAAHSNGRMMRLSIKLSLARKSTVGGWVNLTNSEMPNIST